MAHLWITDDINQGWGVLELDALAYDMTSWPPARIRAGTNANGHDTPGLAGVDEPTVVLRAAREGGREQWVLLAAPGASAAVNGLPLLAGIRVLNDRDELHVGGRCAFFSTERLPHVEAFSAADRPLSCPRCVRPIAIEDGVAPSVVRCPGCESLYHETPQRNCWTHGQTCSLCPQPTSLDSGYRWTPEDL